MVVGRGVLRLLCVFGQQADVALLQPCPQVEGVDVLRELVLVGGVVQDWNVLLFVLVDKGGSYRGVGAVVLHGLRPLVEVELHIGTGDEGVVVTPVMALPTGEGLHGDTLDRLCHHAGAKE